MRLFSEDNCSIGIGNFVLNIELLDDPRDCLGDCRGLVI